MSKTLKNLIFLISILYAVSIEPKFIEKEQYFKPFVSVPLISKPQIEEERQISVFATENNEPKVKKAVKCLFLNGFDVFDISGLTHKTTHKETLNITRGNQTCECDIYFNFCYNLKKESGITQDNKQAYMKVGNEPNIIIGGDIKDGNEWKVIEKEAVNGTKEKWIEIKVKKEGDNSLTYKLKCNDDKSGKGKYKFIKEESSIRNNSGVYNVTLTMESYDACVKVSFYFIFNFINEHYVIFGIILIAFGLFNCLLGNKFARVTSLILCIFIITILVLVFSQFVLPSGCADWIIIVMLVVGLILGTVAGIFAFRHHKTVIAFLVGGICGFFLGQFLYSLFGNRIPVNGIVMNIVFVLVSIGILILITFKLKKEIVIIGTSFIGAYIFIRGISLLAGHFPDEFTIADLVNNGEYEQVKDLLTWHVYVYLTFIVIITILSAIFQFKFGGGEDGGELKSSEKY